MDTKRGDIETPHLIQLADGRVVKMVVEQYYAEGQDTCNDSGSPGSDGATYGLDVVVKGLFVPGSIRTKLTEGTLPSTLEAFKKRAEAMQ